MSRLLTLLIACAALGGCASTGPEDSSLFLAPTGLSDLYSRTSMEVILAITPHEKEGCSAAECDRRAVFDRRVARIGARLADAAYSMYPALKERIPQFSFVVIDKTEAGTASAAGGYIAVLRPVSDIALSDEALTFVIAREMGHVVSQHHERNTATSLAISVVTMALAPVVNVAKLLAVLYSGSSSAAAASTVTSAASFAGSRAIIESYWPTQRQEADVIAMRLMATMGYYAQAVIAGLAKECPQAPPTRWVRELQESVAFISRPAENTASSNTAQAPAPVQSVVAAECTAAYAMDLPSGVIPIIARTSGKSGGEIDTSVALAAQPRPADSGGDSSAQSPQ